MRTPCQIMLLLPDLYDQKSLLLCWHSFSRWDRERLAFFFCVQRLSMLLLCIPTTNLLHNYQTNLTWNHWPTVDAHVQDGAGSVLLSLLHMKGDNTSIMCIHYEIAFLLSNLHDQKSLTLHWRSFCHGRSGNMDSFTLAYYINNGLVAAILSCWCTFSFLTTLFFNDAYKYTL